MVFRRDGFPLDQPRQRERNLIRQESREERARWFWTKTRRVLVNAQVRPVQLWRVTNNLPDHPTSRGSRAHGYLWQVMYCRLRLLKYQFLSHKKGFLCEMRQIHFDINFGNFCCRIKNSFEKSERDPHLGKQLSYSDINTFSNSLYFFNVLTQKCPCLQTRPFQICSLSCLSGTSSPWQVK